MSGPNALTTVTAVKQWIGLATAADDTLLDALVSAVSQAILADLGRSSVLPTIYTELFDGGGADALPLREWPVTQVLACAVDLTALSASTRPDQAGYVLETSGAASPGTMQRLLYRGGVFTAGRQNVSVTYRAGYEVTDETAQIPSTAPYTVAVLAPFGAWALDMGVTGASGGYIAADGVYTFTAADAGGTVSLGYGYVPAPLAQATCEWVADRYAARTRIGQSAKTLGGQETTSFIVKAMPDVVDRLLQPFRRVARRASMPKRSRVPSGPKPRPCSGGFWPPWKPISTAACCRLAPAR